MLLFYRNLPCELQFACTDQKPLFLTRFSGTVSLCVYLIFPINFVLCIFHFIHFFSHLFAFSSHPPVIYSFWSNKLPDEIFHVYHGTSIYFHVTPPNPHLICLYFWNNFQLIVFVFIMVYIISFTPRLFEAPSCWIFPLSIVVNHFPHPPTIFIFDASSTCWVFSWLWCCLFPPCWCCGGRCVRAPGARGV